MTNRSRWALAGLLAAGAALMVLGQLRFGVGLLYWFAPVPFLLFLRATTGVGPRLVLFGVLVLTWAACAAKYITPPFPPILIVLNGLSFGVVTFIGYMAWDRLHRGLVPALGNLVFAAVLVVLEWVQFMSTPLASNGSAAYTQLENLPLLQSTSLWGIGGISFLMSLFAAVVAQAVDERAIPWRQGAAVVGVIVAVHAFGAFRIGAPRTQDTVRVAAVGTNFGWFGGPLPDAEERARTLDALFDDTNDALAAGARLVVWNEVAAIVPGDEEHALLARAGRVASEADAHLVLAYLRPITEDPFFVENKYVWIGPAGEVVDSYLKSKQVPGEPSQAGDGVARVVETDFGALAGAICYELDFPQIGRARAQDGVDLLFVPSSDNLGVDPTHTQVAAVRAIEGGYSILRSTRMGLSAAIDQEGRIRAWLSSHETDERVMLAELPVGRRWTLYSAVGDVVAYLSMLIVLVAVVVRLRRRFVPKGD